MMQSATSVRALFQSPTLSSVQLKYPARGRAHNGFLNELLTLSSKGIIAICSDEG